MNETIAALVPSLQLLGSSGGAGLLAWDVIRRVRARWPEEVMPAWLDQQFYDPVPTRMTALVLSVVFAVIFNSMAAILLGDSVLGAADASLADPVSLLAGPVESLLAGSGGFAVSQVIHAQTDMPRSKSQRRSPPALRQPDSLDVPGVSHDGTH
jgi:hypothetical protein